MPSAPVLAANVLEAEDHDPEYYEEFRRTLVATETRGSFDVPNHPVTRASELKVGEKVAFCDDDDLQTFKVCQVESIENGIVYGILFKEVSVPITEQHLGVDTTRSNRRSTPHWTPEDAGTEGSYVEVSLPSIIVFGSLFTTKMKLTERSLKGIQSILESRRRVKAHADGSHQ